MTTEPLEGTVEPAGQAAGTAVAAIAQAPTSESGAMMRMIELVMSRPDVDIDKIERLIAVKERWEAGEKLNAYNAAVAEFKKNPPRVFKDKINPQFDSQYSSLPNLVNTVNECLSPHGLHASWTTDDSDPKRLRVACKLAHSAGHSETVTLSGPPDDTGKKNELQKVRSTLTYLRGATFECVVGIATEDYNPSDDGNGAGKAKGKTPTGGADSFTPEEKATLDAMLDKVDASATLTELTKLRPDIETLTPPSLRKIAGENYNRRKRELKAPAATDAPPA